MRNSHLTPLRCLVALFLLLNQTAYAQPPFRVQHVNPFIGTGGHGHTYPGAVMPHGMVQLSPDTRLEGWDGCSGYHYSDSAIYGFSHTHLSGTGCSDYGDILLMPGNGTASPLNRVYKSSFTHAREKASPGYYAVHLDKHDIDVELTATLRVGFHKYHFNKPNDRFILLDLKHRDEVLESSLRRINDSTFTGLRRSKAWAENQYVFFAIQFSRPVTSLALFLNDKSSPFLNDSINANNIKTAFRFPDGKDDLFVKVAISPVSEEGALRNLRQEGFIDFERARFAATGAWEDELVKIEFDATPEKKKIFYTALYHTAIVPNINMDVDGQYRGRDNQIHKADGFTYYSVFSLWDTYRSAHPLYTLIDQKRTVDYIKTFLVQYQQGGQLPIWELSSNETDCMIGNHSIPVIVDAWMKGIKGYDERLALEAMLKASYWDHEGMQGYMNHGAVMVEDDHESVSKTMEYAYNDYCVALMADQLGDHATAGRFYQRAQHYKNLFDPVTGFMRPVKNGGWLEPFEPREVNNHFTEANSWQYSFYFPQDIGGYIDMIGGPDSLEKKLDALFNAPDKTTGRDQSDITGLIGQYAHGNEPSHHIIYLYNYTRNPWKTQYYAAKVMNEFYKNDPDGLIGNEDCGQMSAWYVMSAMGIYPVTPGNGKYMIGSPQANTVVLMLENGKVFQIHTRKSDSSHVYVSKADLGFYGEKGMNPIKSPVIRHEDFMRGGYIVYQLSDDKNKCVFSEVPTEIPLSKVELASLKKRKTMDMDSTKRQTADTNGSSAFVVNPIINGGAMAFQGTKTIEMVCAQPDVRIYVSTNGEEPTEKMQLYSQPLVIDSTTIIKAIAIDRQNNRSKVVTAHFKKSTNNWKVTLNTPFEPQYEGGGAQGLVDGIRGTTNWRMGNWQGYQLTNFDATLDLNEIKELQSVRIGFLQDVRAWIVMPGKLTILTSVNGKDYKVAYMGEKFLPIEDLNPQVKSIQASFEKQRVRFIRIVANQYGKLPAWHEGAGGDTHIFVDEVEID
jgi:predicted alpha-1,2-mannosidase